MTVAANRAACRLGIVVGGILTVAVGSTPALAGQASPWTIYPLPTPVSGPCATTVTPGGTDWFVEWATSRIGRVTPDGKLSEFPIPQAGPQVTLPSTLPTDIPCSITQGGDGNLYFTNGIANQIGTVDPSTGRITLYTAPDTAGNLVPFNDIAAGDDGAIWFTETTGNAIGRFDLKTHAFSSYEIPTPASTPVGIVQGPDGAIWFAESAANKIGRLDAATGQITEYPLPTPAAVPFVMRAVTGGRYVWFTETGAGALGRVDTETGAVAEVPLPAGSAPIALCEGSDGDIYYNSPARNVLGRVSPGTFSVTEIPVPEAASEPIELGCGADGSVWAMLHAGNSVARYAIG